MNLRKMRHQRGRVRVTVRPADLDAHPAGRLQWISEVVKIDQWNAYAACAHCHRRRPCPTEVYLHGRDGHSVQMCGAPVWPCSVEQNARLARETETV